MSSSTPLLTPDLIADIRRQIRSVVRRWGDVSKCGTTPNDVEQHVLMIVLTKPPVGIDHPAKRNAWIKVTTRNHIISLCRQYDRATPAQVDDKGGPDHQVSPFARIRLSEARRVLENYYPIALPLFELRCEEPDLTATEEAEILGWTRANVYQVACRMRNILDEHLGRAPRSKGKSSSGMDTGVEGNLPEDRPSEIRAASDSSSTGRPPREGPASSRGKGRP